MAEASQTKAQWQTMTEAEMMERAATCFEKAATAMQGSPEHHAWKKAGELWRKQAGVNTPQKEAEASP
ncbi:MAG: hypothetical protein O7G84_00900 [Gammaproteobacteria bacterium]|nr:hypothetical protein [Gammaproteobacteria bacterium]